jgi:chromosomal replication initiation ATPase DnaA
MVTIDPKAYTEINDFIRHFKITYSKKIKVSFVIDEIQELNLKNQELISFEKIEEIMNKMLNTCYNKPFLITSKSRDHKLILYRYIMFKFLCDIGYTLVAIGEYFGFSYCTVLHGRNRIKDLVSINDKETINIINLLNDKIQRHLFNN